MPCLLFSRDEACYVFTNVYPRADQEVYVLPITVIRLDHTQGCGTINRKLKTTNGESMQKRCILFDWGNTLMVDFNQPGPMCEWEHVEAVDGAAEVCNMLSKNTILAVVTNGSESGAEEVQKALARVGFESYITRIFAQKDIGMGKPDPALFAHVLYELHMRPQDCVMVGDNLEKDVLGALACGIDAVWLNSDVSVNAPAGVTVIHCLHDLIQYLDRM